MTNLATNLVTAAHEHGDNPAVKLDDNVLTYGQMLDAAAAVAGDLQERGIRPATGSGWCCPTSRRSRSSSTAPARRRQPSCR